MTEQQLAEFRNKITFFADHRLAPFGAFHCFCLMVTFTSMAFAVYFTIKRSEKTLYYLFVFSSVLMWLGEAYKQFYESFPNGKFEYQWYYFPFQFCSTPLYVYPLCSILRKGKTYNALSLYSGTYCLFAGASVLLISPTTVLGTGNGNYGIAIQSMLHHTLMMSTGISALVYSAKRGITLKLFFGNIAVFLSLLVVAEILNFGLPVWTGQDVNMYFISASYPTKGNPLGIFRDYYSSTPFGYPLLVVVYCLVFTEIACLFAFVAHRIANKKSRQSSLCPEKAFSTAGDEECYD